MRFTDVCIEALTYVLPEERVTSAAIERWLKPLYERLRLPEGRLELMTGIRERRFWKRGTKPGEKAAEAGAKALEQGGVSPGEVDCLLYCAVSRDFVEPATSTTVHRLLGLGAHALNFDISNACLGVLSGILAAAGLIQSGYLHTALVVAAEDGRPLVENTVRRLREARDLTRREIKPYFASLTIGSAATAVLLRRRSLSRSGHRLLGGAALADTRYNHLCQGAEEHAGDPGAAPMMYTDAERLLESGLDVARRTWRLFEKELGWTRNTPDVICTHQVGRVHRRRFYQEIGLDPEKDFSTFEFLGNTGAAALPVTAAMAVERGLVPPGGRLALLGIGSGINCIMFGVEW